MAYEKPDDKRARLIALGHGSAGSDGLMDMLRTYYEGEGYTGSMADMTAAHRAATSSTDLFPVS